MLPRSAAPFLLLLLLLLPCAGCASFGAPRSETLQRIGPMPLARMLPGQFECELASPGLTGTFDAVCAIAPRQLRLQLFPDVGGKVLDLVVDAGTVTADLAGHRYQAEAPLAEAAPHLALALAALVAELAAPVAGGRVLGERLGEGGLVEVQLRPALGSGEVTAVLDAEGRVASYRIRLGALEVTLEADGRFAGRGFSGHLLALGGAPGRG